MRRTFMNIIRSIKKLFTWKLIFGILLAIIIANVLLSRANAEEVDEEVKLEIRNFIEETIAKRNRAIVTGEEESIKSVYDMGTKYGRWAYENEEKKMIYLHNWEQKQGVRITEIIPKVVVNRISEKENGFKVNFTCSTEYRYVYEDRPKEVNAARIGTYHVSSLISKDDSFIINKEWYTDPFADSLNLEKLKVDDVKEFILSQERKDFSNLDERRKASVEYANKYCGAATEEEFGYKYNKEYRNFNPEGGDCANFASQILHEGGKFKVNSAWNYSKGEASASWVNADKFKNYWVHSGRASVIAYGTYDKVYKASYQLMPGDFVAYEKKGDIKHISTVTNTDSRGYALVTCHNTDRNDVPWDLGWSDKNIKFWLVRVHY
jgi:aspartate carbamoyltransferase regulatory subunit